jgi:hypothetical protein
MPANIIVYIAILGKCFKHGGFSVTKNQWEKIEQGDIIRNISSKNVYVVLERFPSGYVIAKTVAAYNHSEWEKIKK